MEYSVEYDEDSDVCEVQISGLHKRPEDSQELLRLAGSFAAKHGCFRFLFDLRKANIVGGTMDAYEIVIDHAKFGVSTFFRIAAVYQAITDDVQFMENLGANRGAASYKVFDDIDVAREWIAKKE
jgi:hypothetical protein